MTAPRSATILSREPGPMPGTTIVTYDLDGVDRGQITIASALIETAVEDRMIADKLAEHQEAAQVLKENPL